MAQKKPAQPPGPGWRKINGQWMYSAAHLSDPRPAATSAKRAKRV